MRCLCVGAFGVVFVVCLLCLFAFLVRGVVVAFLVLGVIVVIGVVVLVSVILLVLLK